MVPPYRIATNLRPTFNWLQSRGVKFPQIRLSRRQLFKGMGWAGTGIGIMAIGNWLRDTFETVEPPTLTQRIPATKSQFQFKFVSVNHIGEEIKREIGTAQYITEDLGNEVTLEMVEIPGGKFMMGTDDGEIEGLVDKFDWEYFRRERPIHEVRVSPFLIGKYPITQKQWRAITTLDKIDIHLKPDPSDFKGDDRPVTNVSWDECVEFCKRLSKLTKQEYKLPSEAQWEYSCRAGSITPFYFGETITTDLANYDGNEVFASEPKGRNRRETTPVGQFPPNAFGLYDMQGNVWEWCADDWHNNYEGAPSNESAWITSDNDSAKVIRGGAYYSLAHLCRSAYRLYSYGRGFNGFRVVCLSSKIT